MPIYVFEAADGERRERFYLIAQRPESITEDGKDFRRIIAPENLAIIGSAPDDLSVDDQIRKGLHKLECDEGADAFKRMTHSAQETLDILAEPLPQEDPCEAEKLEEAEAKEVAEFAGYEDEPEDPFPTKFETPEHLNQPA